MSSKASDGNATNSAKKAKDDVTKDKKLRKSLNYLFTQNGLKIRNIPHGADDEVAVEDIITSDHFKGQFSEEDFDRAIAKDHHNIILKEEPHFLLVTSNGCKMVKYFKEGLEYKGSADIIQLNDRASCELSQESAAGKEAVNEEEQGECKENEKMEQKNDSAAGGKKKKTNKKNKAVSGGSPADTNKLQSKKEPEESPLPSVPVEKETSESAKSETKIDKNKKHQNDPTGSNAKSQPSKETKAKDKSAQSTSETKDQVVNDMPETTADEGAFTPASGKKSSKKKEKQPEASEIKNSGIILKQNKIAKQPAEELGRAGKQTETLPEKGGKQTEESLGKGGKQTEKSLEKGGKQPEESLGKDGKQTQKSPGKGKKPTKEQKVTESKENAEKQKTDNSSKKEELQKKLTDDVNSAVLSSDEEKTSASAEGPPSKKKKKKSEDKSKQIPKTFEFLFGKGGLKDKEIPVMDDGFVKVRSIVEVYDSQYKWTEDDVHDALKNNEDYKFKRDGTDVLLVKSTAEQKNKVVDRPVEIQEPCNDDSWKESGKRRGQDDRRQRPPQNITAGRSTVFSSMVPDKLCGTLFWILAKDGAAKHSVQFQPGKRVYVDEIIKKVPTLNQVSASEIKAAADSDPRKSFVVEEVNGQLMIWLQENRAPRDRNADHIGKSDFHLSKTMSFLLRHGAEKLQLPIQSDGYMFVEDLLSCKDLRSYKEEDVKRVVQDNDKQRFLLTQDPQTGRLKVRANQGHTLVVPDLELQPITSASDVPVVVHGTYHNSWKSIQKQGLSRMTRNHIHFAAGEPGADGVISGMRQSCEVLIFLDLEKALNDGLKFFRSANNVILSSGDDKGIVAPKYFKTVVQRSPRMLLM